MTARDQILDRLRAVRRERDAPEHDDTQARTAIADRLASRAPTGPIPPLSADRRELLARFTTKAEAAQAQVRRVENATALPAALAESLRDRNLPPALRMGDEPLFAGLDWNALEISRGPGRREEPATLSRADWGVAETGSLVFLSGSDNPVTLALLGENHFVALRDMDVLGNFEEVWSNMRENALDPRTVNFVTGPSRSADIEQRLELGAHGPVSLTVFLVGDGVPPG